MLVSQTLSSPLSDINPLTLPPTFKNIYSPYILTFLLDLLNSKSYHYNYRFGNSLSFPAFLFSSNSSGKSLFQIKSIAMCFVITLRYSKLW